MDRLLTLGMTALRSRVPLFQLCGYTGFLLAFLLSMVLVRNLGLSELTLLGITGTVILTFYVLMMVTKILASGEVIIYYHHEIAVIATSALFLRVTDQPVRPYLDVLALGLGLFLACGRIGCLLVGCCHGRPCKWGVRYGDDHACAGFPDYLVNVKLFPIQAVESALALGIVACGLTLLLRQHRPGSVLLLYVIAYGCGRFCLEFFRGDAARPYFCGFSEAQWTSLLLAIAALLTGYARILPGSNWHLPAVAVMVAGMILASSRRHFDRSRRFELLHPSHIREIGLAVRHLKSLQGLAPASEKKANTTLVHLARTSTGYRFSVGSCAAETDTVEHFSISREDPTLSLGATRIFASLLARLSGRHDSFELIEGNNGVVHMLFVHPGCAQQSGDPRSPLASV